MRQLEDQLNTILDAEQDYITRAQITALFWKTQYMELHLRYKKLERDCILLREQQLLPDEIDDGK